MKYALRLRPDRKTYLLFEFVAVFIGLPGLYATGWIRVYSIPLLMLLSLACLFILIRDPGFDNRQLIRLGAWKEMARPMLIRLLVLYPLLSVYPQGLTHRAFLLHRYRPIFSGTWNAIFLSAAAFSFMHIVFQNPVAVVLTFAGGILFAKTYLDSGSLVLSAIEHALYGIFVFTIGLGRYLYMGMLR